MKFEGDTMNSVEIYGGTVRERTAEEALDRLKPLLPEFGITRIADVTGLDTIGIPVMTVVRPLARSLSVSQGKGVTKELAILSGIMESIEVFHAEQPRPSLTTCSVSECIRNPAFVSPYSLPIRADANLSGDTAIAWVEGENLFARTQKKIPSELFDLDFARRETVPFFLASSNGLASGNTRTEAIVHGLCEVIERDQTSFWLVERDWLDLRMDRRVSIDSIDDAVCRSLIERCLSAGLEIFVWHISINIDIPVFACTIADRHKKTLFPQHATGHGCHPIATIALARAITEAAQSRLTHISGLREDLTWARYRDEFLCESSKNKDALEKMSQQLPAVDFRKLRSASEQGSTSMPSLLEGILERLRRVDLENAIVVDLAANEIFSVVFVVVPGLEYLTTKAARLYTPGSRMRDFILQHKLHRSSES
jgi:ribosomal protein S12 methylthiotransferase accessory factor